MLFWPEISALGYFLILITNVCTPLNTQVPPPPPPPPPPGRLVIFHVITRSLVHINVIHNIILEILRKRVE